MNFLISVIQVNKGKAPLPKKVLENLNENARYLRRYNVWLFEGDWETELSQFEGLQVKHLGDVVLESLSKKEASDKRLEQEVVHLFY